MKNDVVKSFVCSDLGKGIGDTLDLKGFGEYKITNIEEYNMDHVNIKFYVRPLYMYTLELIKRYTREVYINERIR